MLLVDIAMSAIASNCSLDSPVLGVVEVAFLLKKSPATVYADRSRSPHLLPPDCTPPGSRQPIWLLQDVLNWLAQYRRPVVSAPAGICTHKAGSPRKAERLAAARAGMTVKEYRSAGGTHAQ